MSNNVIFCLSSEYFSVIQLNGDSMTFRKDCLLFYEIQITLIILLLLTLFLIPIIGFKYVLLIEVVFVLLMLLNFKVHSEYITINENGIICCQNQKILWEYKWTCVAELRRSSRFLLPSIEIMVFDSNKNLESPQLSGCYFQLSGKAKIAIEKYQSSKI